MPEESGSGRVEKTGVVEVSPKAAVVATQDSSLAGVVEGDPIPFPSGFDPFLKGEDTAARAHRALEREPRDDAWASESEAEWARYLAANAGLAGYGAPDVQCRTTRCEVRLLAVGAPVMGAAGWFGLLFPSREGLPGSLPPALAFDEKDGTTAVAIQIKYRRSGIGR